jgi:hypothetical protein
MLQNLMGQIERHKIFLSMEKGENLLEKMRSKLALNSQVH